MAATASEARWSSILGRQELPALIVGSGRKVLAANAAFRARFTGGEDPAGRFCFELAHHSRPPCDGAGGRCPLELADAGMAPVVHRHLTCLQAAYDQVTARSLPSGAGQSRSYLLVYRPLAPAPYSHFLAGSSPAILRLLEEVERAAPGDSAVVIRGEGGTGKICVARLLHDLSRRSAGPFVSMDCSGAEGSTLERELFPRHEGAAKRIGKDEGLVAAAAGGSLLMVEPQRLAPSLQQRLGRLLAARAGEVAHCRWLFAVDQAQPNPRGGLAELLLGSASILVPPLRDRMEDLPVLLDGMVRRLRGARDLAVDPAAIEKLRHHSFPGNLRELESLVERACLIANGDRLRPEHFPPELGCDQPLP